MIEIRSLNKRYPLRTKDSTWKHRLSESLRLRAPSFLQALDGIDLQIKKGEVFGILGPNGAGKTTLLKIIAGFLLPEEGNVKVNGFDIIKERRDVRLSVNFLRAGGWVIFDYKYPIDKLLEFWGIFMGGDREEALQNVDKVLDIVGLLDKKKEFPENLSAGMRQRLNLARCLMAPRPLYLFDEPTVNIDPYSANFIRKYAKTRLARNGTTIVLATHNLWEAEMMCDRVAILFNGKLLKIGTPRELKKGFGKHALILKLKKSSANLLYELKALPYVAGVKTKGKRITVFGDELRPKIIEILNLCKKYTQITYVDLRELSLNEVFLKIIEEADT